MLLALLHARCRNAPNGGVEAELSPFGLNHFRRAGERQPHQNKCTLRLVAAAMPLQIEKQFPDIPDSQGCLELGVVFRQCFAPPMNGDDIDTEGFGRQFKDAEHGAFEKIARVGRITRILYVFLGLNTFHWTIMTDSHQKSFAKLKADFEQMQLDFKLRLDDMRSQVQTAQKREQAAALDQIKSLMADFDLTPADIGATRKTKKEKSVKVAVKFRGPEGQTWSGRGRAPLWLGSDRDKYRLKENDQK